MQRESLNITMGTDVMLNDTLTFDGSIFDVSLAEDIEANLVSKLAKRTALEVSVEDNYLVIAIPWVDGRLPGFYGLEVRGTCNGMRWRTYSGSLIRYTVATEPGSAEASTSADPYDITQAIGYRYSDSPLDQVTASVDNAVGTPTVITTYKDRKLDLAFKNLKGERGNGIASITEEDSEEDGGINTVTITDDDGNEHTIHTRNGRQGPPGADRQPVESGDVIIANELGGDETKVMSQKAISDILCPITDLTSEFIDGFVNGNVGQNATVNTAYGSTYIHYRTSDVVDKVFRFKLKSSNSGRWWVKIKDGKVVEKSTDTANSVGEDVVAYDGTFDEIAFNTQSSYSAKYLYKTQPYLEILLGKVQQIQSGMSALDGESDMLSSMEEGYISTTIGKDIKVTSNSSYKYLRTSVVWPGLIYELDVTAGMSGRAWAKVKNGIVVAVSPDTANVRYRGSVVCDGTFDQLVINSKADVAKKLTLKRNFTLTGDEVLFDTAKGMMSNSFAIEELQAHDEVTMPYNGMPLPQNPTELKLLAIGNSFTNNTLGRVKAMLESMGLDDKFTCGITYAAGESLAAEVTAFDNDTSIGTLTYRKQGGEAVTVQNITPKQALDYDDWDVIMLQQASADSADLSSYSNLVALVDRIRVYSKNRPKIIFNLTWALSNSTGQSYGGKYNMYLELMKVAKYLHYNLDMDIVNPLYQAFQQVQNDAVSEGMADLLDISGYHANDYGQVVAAMAFIESVVGVCFNKSIRSVTYRDDYLTNENADALIQCVRTACAHPFVILPDGANE